MWSEPGSVAQSEPSGCIVLGCAVYILQRSDSVPLLSRGRDLRSLLSQEEESGGWDLWEESSEVPAVGPVGAYQEQDIVQQVSRLT